MIRWSPAKPLRPRCPHERLVRLLAKLLPPDVSLRKSSLRPWASANFIGARHQFWLDILCEDGRKEPSPVSALAVRLQEQLAETEWPLFQHIVADLTAEALSDDSGILLEMLTVEE